MKLFIDHGDILDVEADMLVCSANVFLQLSGGVGGAFLLRYGHEMQDWLNRYLLDTGQKHVPIGTLVAAPPCDSPYLAVFHAVAVTGSYESSIEIVTDLIVRAIDQCGRNGGCSIAVPALATGFGHLSISDFGDALAAAMLRAEKDSPVDSVLVRVRHANEAESIKQAAGDF